MNRGSAVTVLIVVLLLVIMGLSSAHAYLTSQSKIPTAGIIKSVGVAFYTDSMGTQNLTALDWGNVFSGSTISKQAYLKNTGNVPNHISMMTSNWNPASASKYLNCTWNTNGLLQPNQTIPVTFTLTVSPMAESLSSFSFDIIITATESKQD